MLAKLAELQIAPPPADGGPPWAGDRTGQPTDTVERPSARLESRPLPLSPASPDEVRAAAGRSGLAALPPELLTSDCARLTAGELLQGIAMTGPLLGKGARRSCGAKNWASSGVSCTARSSAKKRFWRACAPKVALCSGAANDDLLLMLNDIDASLPGINAAAAGHLRLQFSSRWQQLSHQLCRWGHYIWDLTHKLLRQLLEADEPLRYPLVWTAAGVRFATLTRQGGASLSLPGWPPGALPRQGSRRSMPAYPAAKASLSGVHSAVRSALIPGPQPCQR